MSLGRHLKKVTAKSKEYLSFLLEQPVVGPSLKVVGKTGKGFVRDDCHIMAAAISFYAILSLIPFLFLLLSIAGYVLDYIGKDYASQEELFAHISTYVKAVVPFLSDDIMQRIEGITHSRETYGITGLVVLLITAGLVFRTLELAFARIFDAKRHRSLVVSQLLFIVFLMGLGLLFLSIHYIGILTSSFYSARSESFGQSLDLFLSENLFLRLIISIFTATSVFVLLLKYFSYEKVRLRYAIAGGLLFSILWMSAIKVFGYYLTNIARFSLLYGSLATLAVIVVWMFYSSCILLLCVEFTWVLQNYKQYEEG
jgi:membrane protein